MNCTQAASRSFVCMQRIFTLIAADLRSKLDVPVCVYLVMSKAQNDSLM